MSPSSAASKPSSAGSSATAPQLEPPAGDGLVARLERAVAPYAHRFAEAPAVLALRESLPIAFGVVVIALIAILVAQPFTGVAGAGARAARGDRAGVRARVGRDGRRARRVRLALRLALRARAAGRGRVRQLLARCCRATRSRRSALSSRTRGATGWGAFATTLGASGLFTAIVVASRRRRARSRSARRPHRRGRGDACRARSRCC